MPIKESITSGGKIEIANFAIGFHNFLSRFSIILGEEPYFLILLFGQLIEVLNKCTSA